MAKEKIKVSVIIDKEVAKNIAFRVSNTPEMYDEIKKIIDRNSEIVHDNTEETDEKVAKAGDFLIGSICINSILRANKDLLLTKQLDEGNKHDEEPGGNDASVEGVKLDGDKVNEIFESIFRKE